MKNKKLMAKVLVKKLKKSNDVGGHRKCSCDHEGFESPPIHQKDDENQQ